MARSALIVNPNATGVTPELVNEVERELAAAGPLDVLLTERPMHAAELAETSCSNCERIYVFAGDGGYNEVVNGLAEDIPIGFIPGGSTSVLPRALGLPRDPVACARMLAHAAAPRLISLGRVNGRRFTFGSGIGIDAELVRRVDALGRDGGRRAGDLTFARTLVGILAERRGRFDTVLDVVGLGRVALAFVANCDPYTFMGRVPLHMAPRARFELGLDLVAPRRIRLALMPELAWWLFAGRGQQRSTRVLYVHDADELRIVCDAPMPLQADGEDLGDVTEARYEAERGAVRVLAPEHG